MLRYLSRNYSKHLAAR